MSKELKDTYSVEIDGCDIDFEYTYELGEKETRDDPGTDTSIDIKHAWMHLADKNGNMVNVDVMGILDLECDYDWLQEQIVEYIEEYEPDPDD